MNSSIRRIIVVSGMLCSLAGGGAPRSSGADELQRDSPGSSTVTNRVVVQRSGPPREETPPAGAGLGVRPIDSLQRVSKGMQEATEVLAARDYSGRASAFQRQALRELDALAEQLQQQYEKMGGQRSASSSTQGPRAAAVRPGAAPGESSGATSSGGATTGTVVDRAAIGRLVKDLWGQLPERRREELLQPFGEEFLPQYAADIEEYFRVLAGSAASAEENGNP